MYFALNGLKGHIKWHNDMLVILKKLGWEKLRRKKKTLASFKCSALLQT